MSAHAPTRLRVLLADDHRILREGLRALLAADPGIDVVGEAGSGREAVERVRGLAPDIVVMDVTMPDLNGIEATRQIRARAPCVRVVGLSTHADARFVRSMLEAGAGGYVVKSAAGDELLRAIHSVARGRAFVSPQVTGALVAGFLGHGPPPPASPLSPREREVLQLVAEGCSTADIATRLFLSPDTVETHRRNLLRKLGLRGVAELTRYAIREGITSLEP